jgi:hypothetical protein
VEVRCHWLPSSQWRVLPRFVPSPLCRLELLTCDCLRDLAVLLLDLLELFLQLLYLEVILGLPQPPLELAELRVLAILAVPTCSSSTWSITACFLRAVVSRDYIHAELVFDHLELQLPSRPPVVPLPPPRACALTALGARRACARRRHRGEAAVDLEQAVLRWRFSSMGFVIDEAGEDTRVLAAGSARPVLVKLCASSVCVTDLERELLRLVDSSQTAICPMRATRQD